MTITPEEQERIEACVAEIAEILQRHTPESEITNLEAIEKYGNTLSTISVRK